MDANLQRGMLENVDMSSAIHQLQVIFHLPPSTPNASQHRDNLLFTISRELILAC